MVSVFVASLISVVIVSLISFIGVVSLSMKADKLRKVLIYLISFAAGAMLGDAFIHLLPEAVLEFGFGLNVSAYLLGGIVIFFVLEKVIQWQHCHGHMLEEKHVHPFAYVNLVGDGVHNFLDGVIVAVGYIVSFPVGIATTIAVVLHEIPQEIGDFGVLLHGGFSKGKALLLNFASGLIAIFGVVAVFLLGDLVENLQMVLIPVAVGGFIYIAGSDLIPQLHNDSRHVGRSLLQLLAFVVGILIMAGLLFLE